MGLRELKKCFPRQLLIKELINAPNNAQTAKNLNIPALTLKELIDSYKITTEEYKLERHKKKWLRKYDSIVAILQRHPSTAELQQTPKWKTVYHAISRFWGNFDNFRLEFGIPKLGIGHFADAENKNAWQEGLIKGREVRTQRKEERKRRILDYMKNRQTVSAKELRQELDITDSCLSVYLNELQHERLIQKIRSGKASAYVGVTP